MLVIANLTLFAAGKADQINLSKPSSPNSVEEISDSECFAGGPGAQQCSIAAGVHIGDDIVKEDCKAECKPYEFACCGLHCSCIPIR